MEFQVLGSLQLMRDGRPVWVGGPRRRLLLAVLLSEANRPLRYAELLRALHDDPDRPDRPSTQAGRTQAGRTQAGRTQAGRTQAGRAQAGRTQRARTGGEAADHRRALHRLHVQVGDLRKLLGQADGRPLARVADGYLLHVGPEELDELLFLRSMEQARRLREAGEVADAAHHIDVALGLWRGEPLSDLEHRPFVERYAGRLRELRLVAEKERSAAYLAAGRHGPLVSILRRLLADNPGDEQIPLDLATALYRSGRREEAAQVCQAALARCYELGLDSAAARGLQQAILADDPSLRWQPPQERAGLAGRRPVPSQLPADIRTFTGRDEEVARLVQLLEPAGGAAHGVVAAIAGKAGVGKTALAIHVAHLVRDRFSDGVLYANLQATPDTATDPSVVLVSFLLGLGVPREHMQEDLGSRSALFRSTLGGLRLLVVLDNAIDEEQVRSLLPGTSSCAVLVTSRRALRGLDADVLELDVLDRAGAVTLLAKVVGEARVSAEAADAEAIVDLCGQLPLAVRIAGALLAQRPAARLSWLRHELEGARLAVLRAGDLEVRASVDLSYRRLPADARRAFRLLSVPETEEVSLLAASALLDVDLRTAERLVEGLVDAQLVGRAAGDGTSPRYRFHDLLRLFARERLAAEDGRDSRRAAFGRLLEAYLLCAEGAAGRLHVGNAPIVPRQSTRGWEPADPAAVSAAVASPARWFSRERSCLVALVEQAGAEGFDEMAWLLSSSIVDLLEVGAHWTDWRRTHECALEAAMRAGSRRAEANVRRNFGWLRRLQGNRAEARSLLGESLRLFQEAAWPVGEAAARRLLGELDIDDGRIEEAIAHLLASKELYRENGIEFGVARSIQSLGRAYAASGRLDRAVTCQEAAVGWFRQTMNELSVGRAKMALGSAYLRIGRIDDAVRLLDDAAEFFQAEGHLPLQAEALLLLGDAHSRRGRDILAFACYDACLSIFAERRDQLNQARTLAYRGRLHMWRGESAQARGYWRQALALFRDRGGAEEAAVREWLARGPGSRFDGMPERVLDRFDHGGFIRNVAGSEYIVRILSTWTELLSDPIRDAFLDAVRTALAGGALVEVLLLDPESPAAAERTREIGGKHDVAALAYDNARHLRAFGLSVGDAPRRHLAVRLYSSRTDLAYYRWDERALVATLPFDGSSTVVSQYEVPVDSPRAQIAEQRFAQLWDHGSRPLGS